MLFNSLTYYLFLPIVCVLYRISPKQHKILVLLLASYFFYASWDLRLLALIAISTAVNYWCGLLIRSREMSSRQIRIPLLWLILSFLSVGLRDQTISDLRIAFLFPVSILSLENNPLVWVILAAFFLAVLYGNVFYLNMNRLDEAKRRKGVVATGIAANLLMLGFFKYYNFFIDNVEWILRELSFDPGRFHLDIILPIGLSFYSFKGISYVIDVYRKDLDPEQSYIRFSLFLAFFPALLAGPLDRAKDLLPQFSGARTQTMAKTYEGMHLIFLGLFKKVVVADGLVRTVNSVFSSGAPGTWIDVVVATIFFTIQIYCDFSGYTDIARGTAKLFGIDLMLNFDLPYFSKNPREFWSRWHISLSTWLRDYLYIPLGGSRLGRNKTYRNLMLTMGLGGLWHGAAWNFIFWGFYHGFVLCVHRGLSAFRTVKASRWTLLGNGFKIVFFFLVVSYGWLLFRAQSLEKILSLSSVLFFDFNNLLFTAARPRVAALLGIAVLAAIELMEYLSNRKPFYEKFPRPAWTALYSLIIFSFLLSVGNESAQFVYFKF